MSRNLEAIVDEVMWRGAIREPAVAQTAIQIVLEALAEQLPRADARAIAERLPPPFAAVLMRGGAGPAPAPETVYASLAAREGVTFGLALEHAGAACAAIAGALDAEDRHRLARALRPEWAALVAPPEVAREVDVPHGIVAGHGHTLATGKPGSAHPLAEAEPRPAQADSVASENPHADIKLSSSGASSSPDHLATGRPGADRPLSEATDDNSG